MQDENGKTPMHYIFKHRMDSILALFLDKGQILSTQIDFKVQDFDGNTPLHCEPYGHRQLLLQVFERVNPEYVDLNLVNNEGESVFSKAYFSRRNLDEVRAILKYAKKHNISLKFPAYEEAPLNLVSQDIWQALISALRNYDNYNE